jgi:ABC-type uncharacterized transport system permease subunit
MDIVLYALVAFLYGVLAVATPRPAAAIAMAGGAAGGMASHSAGATRALLAVALLAHGVLLQRTIFPSDAMVFGFAFALSAMFWLGVLIFWIEGLFFPIDAMRRLVLPPAAVAVLLPLVFGGVRVLPYAASLLFKFHFVIANAAYGLFVVAAVHAVLMLMAEQRLHTLRGGDAAGGAAWLDALPPLLTLERLLFRLIGTGFVLLTLTLVSGFVFTERLDEQLLRFDHKTVFAILSWLMFGGVLLVHRLSGWRGRGAARWVLASFAALVLAYVGSRFVFEVLLHRPVV